MLALERQKAAARVARVSHAMLRGYDLSDTENVHATRLIGAFVLGFFLLELGENFCHSAPDAEIPWRPRVRSTAETKRQGSP